MSQCDSNDDEGDGDDGGGGDGERMVGAVDNRSPPISVTRVRFLYSPSHVG